MRPILSRLLAGLPAPALELRFAEWGELRGMATLSRASQATFVNNIGTIVTVAADTPRFTHNPLSHVAQGLLLEKECQQLLSHTETFSDAAWIKSSVSVADSSGLAPNGLQSSSLITDISGSALSTITQNVICENDTVARTGSFHFKAGSAQRSGFAVGYGNGVGIETRVDFVHTEAKAYLMYGVGSFSVVPYPSNIYRLSISQANNATGNTRFYLYSIPDTSAISGVGSIYLWGSQAEPGSVMTSYIPPGASPATRAADIATALVPNGRYDVLVQDRYGAAWTLGVVASGGAGLAITPRAGQSTVAQWRAWRADVVPASRLAALAVAY